MAGFGDFYYQYNGLEPLTVSAAAAREMFQGYSVRLDYEIFSRPYKKWSFIGGDAYTLSTVKLSVIKKL